MATGADPNSTNNNFDDLLKCTICLETFTEPKCLPCLHTFCKLCIHKYIDSLKEKEGEIPCPVCRQSISSDKKLEDTETIVNKLPGNHFILSLLEKQTITEKQCNLCDFKLGKQIKAVFWCGVCNEYFCERCVEYHNSKKVLAKHKVVSIEDIQNNTALGDTCVLLCEEHQESVVQVYCVDHKKACCTLCATLSHRKCDHVISIEEAAAGIKQNGEVFNLLSRLEESEKVCSDVIHSREGNEETFETEATYIETTVTKMIKEMKDHLDKIQNKILSELEAAKKQMSMKVADDINDFTSYKSAVTNWKNMMSGVLQHGSEQQCLVISSEITSKIEKLNDEMKDALDKIRNTSVRFEVSSIAKEFNETISSIGDLKIGESKLKFDSGKLRLLKTDFRNGDIKIIRTIQVAPSGQTSGIFVDGLMIFATYDTKKVVKYNQNGELLGELSLPNSPYDLCHMTDTQIVVCLPYEESLYIVDYRNMTLLKTIKLNDVPTYGICVYDSNQFLIGSDKQLTWVDQSSGTKVKTVTSKGWSDFISTTRQDDFLHGHGTKSVSYVVNGVQRFTYTSDQLSSPYGKGEDDEENFYVAGYASKNIHQITNNGELIRIIPAADVGVERPWTVRFERRTNKFLVTCYDSGKAFLCSIE